MKFNSYEDLFNHLKELSNNFCAGYKGRETFFIPQPRPHYSDYEWCQRISITDHSSSRYDDFWIYQVEDTEKGGIVYSNGAYTSGKHYCTPSFEQILKQYNDIAMRLMKNPGFVEPDVAIIEYETAPEQSAWDKYCSYLKQWAEDHKDSSYEGQSPVCYDEWYDNEYSELSHDDNDIDH